MPPIVPDAATLKPAGFPHLIGGQRRTAKVVKWRKATLGDAMSQMMQTTPLAGVHRSQYMPPLTLPEIVSGAAYLTPRPGRDGQTIQADLPT
jgi:hypothetical protein